MPDWSTKPDVKAHCLDCGWTSTAKNAHGIGAQHARRLGHHVAIDVHRVHYYNDPDPPARPAASPADSQAWGLK